METAEPWVPIPPRHGETRPDEDTDHPCDQFVNDPYSWTMSGKPACLECGWSEDAHA